MLNFDIMKLDTIIKGNMNNTLFEELEHEELDVVDQIALSDILHATKWSEENSPQFKYYIENNE